MTVYAHTHVFRDATITINSVAYANQLSKAQLTPDTPIQTQRTLVPDGAIVDIDSSVWTLSLTGVESRHSTGLAAALDAAAGTQIDVVLQPKTGSGQDVATFTIVAVPVSFGGEQGNFRTFDQDFPVVGQPVFSQSS